MAEKLPDGKAPDTYEMPVDGWVCFHCGVRFKKPGEAREHFGEKPAKVRIREAVDAAYKRAAEAVKIHMLGGKLDIADPLIVEIILALQHGDG